MSVSEESICHLFCPDNRDGMIDPLGGRGMRIDVIWPVPGVLVSIKWACNGSPIHHLSHLVKMQIPVELDWNRILTFYRGVIGDSLRFYSNKVFFYF